MYRDDAPPRPRRRIPPLLVLAAGCLAAVAFSLGWSAREGTERQRLGIRLDEVDQELRELKTGRPPDARTRTDRLEAERARILRYHPDLR